MNSQDLLNYLSYKQDSIYRVLSFLEGYITEFKKDRNQTLQRTCSYLKAESKRVARVVETAKTLAYNLGDTQKE